MSVLFPLLTLYTLAYMALMGYDFAAKDAFEIPPGLMAVYITLVLAYSADREIRRWIGKALPLRKGTLFVYRYYLRGDTVLPLTTPSDVLCFDRSFR